MEIEFIPVEYYKTFYHILMLILSIITGLTYTNSNGCTKLLQQNSGFYPLIFALLFTFFLGLRPVSGRFFADMGMYNHMWYVVNMDQDISYFDIRKEWFFRWFLIFCKRMVPDSHFWFLMCSIIYIGSQVWACKKLLKENLWLPVLLVFYSYQFFAYGTNGIRNGMACGLMMLILAFFCDGNKKGYLIGTFLFLIAMGCHRSVMLPMVALLGSMFFIKDLKWAIWIWIACIFLSLIGGTTFQHLIMGLGLDDRMESYGSSEHMKRFSRTGFRWDFLLYSAIPLYLIYQVIKQKIQDKSFNLLAGTYLLSNAVWILVCRVQFSNRFAYLSWFLFGLVIAYAVVRIPIWQNQDKKAGLVVIGSALITILLGNM